MSDEEGRAWEADADRDLYLQMRQWDERAKEVDVEVLVGEESVVTLPHPKNA